ncbi:bifunctional glutamate N-acetyltransferase/amino-acid acetyltransferase ArgJ [Psychromarinibacter sp. C21-152]|uniref:Arginine biosynthesis bifunctional protein ArgJ n=1 Tax=Psychromarinibacter sediminicola TaxID=3033385 RepID=A0AAE3T998_9RHOB|nr:bifunctional glutamate N-acetyltransferase/amino-acid acetyltransferase ArgJ [Psychromarinibacter sediminicola]MDF0601628.1 bifunctional glutamate N-acetyltransferase/amino-acid acetyltransferase ArgJ [Psychromarinibacter sediminicola]
MAGKKKTIRKLKRKLKALKARVQAAEPAAPGTKTAPAVSPLAPPGGFPDLPEIGGVRFAAAQAGVRYAGRTDVMLAELAPGTEIAGVFTKSATRAAPVLDCQDKIAGTSKSGAAIVVNSGNANAFTGTHGMEAVKALCVEASKVLGVPQSRVFTSSTGVIGEKLPHDRIAAKLAELKDALSPDGIAGAAQAIMTTDTYPKGASMVVDIDGQEVKIAGIAKGSGMIAPDMATMLVYLFTDAQIAREDLQRMLSKLTETSFNAITVDSDTSTSDTVLLAATGASGVTVGDGRTSAGQAFEAALGDVMRNLAHQVVRDGEGATKFVEVRVTGAAGPADAKKAAMAIANSPLVKTAIAGEDPNWGRIVMAVGKSGAAADRDRLAITFGDIQVARDGWVDPGYREEDGAAYMQREDLVIGVDLGLGDGAATVWTCDLTHAYIEINADYRS